MSEEQQQSSRSSAISFISDIPANEDFFDTHTRLARAIVGAIEDNSEIKVIGLLGRWGSGKSTVAKKIVDFLEAPDDSTFRVFTYDAWLHQSDPLRRSFLESLIRYLVADDAIAKTKWNAELKKLSEPVEDTRTIETPTLSAYGRWLGLSLLAVPVGIGLLDLDTLKEAFVTGSLLGKRTLAGALLLTILPLLVWLLLYLLNRPWRDAWFIRDVWPWKEHERQPFWKVIDEDGHPASALHMFVNGQAKHTNTRTFRSPEPTSLEFGRMFQVLMQEAASGKKRLVILIDNLDRIAEDEALQMWATIRSFFLAQHETDDVKHEPFHPTVILPIDRYAIEELFAGSQEAAGRDRAKSFMDKTFDVTFEVTEPVSSDWRAFLDRQMALMFGEAYQPQWGFWTRRLFEQHLSRQRQEGRPDAHKQTVVTPREINKLLNGIGALYLQWHSEGIPVEVMALYVIHRDGIDKGLLDFLQSDDVGIAPVAPDWKLQIAALHYGVEVAKAGQVTLEEPTRQAIARRDEQGFARMSIIPGFREIFEFVAANLPSAAAPVGPFDILVSAVLLLQSLGGKGEDWETSAWRSLSSEFLRMQPPINANDRAMSVIDLLAAHVEPGVRRAFLAKASALFSQLLNTGQAKPEVEREVRKTAEALIAFAGTHKLPVPTFTLENDAPSFVTRFASLATTATLWRQIRTPHSTDELSPALIEMLTVRAQQRSVPTVVRYLTFTGGSDIYAGEDEIDFDELTTTADQLVRQPQEYNADWQPGIAVLAELSFGRTVAQDRLTALVDEGVVSTRLGEAIEEKKWNAAAELVAILLWRGQKFAPPASMRWAEYTARDPEHLSRIISSLRLYYPSRLVRILWASYDVNTYPTSSFVEEIIGYAVSTDRLGTFNATEVFANLPKYRYAVPYRHRDRFLEQLERQSSLIDALESAPVGPQILEAAKYLTRKGGEKAARAEAVVRQHAETADQAAWTAAIQKGGDLFDIGMSAAKSGQLRLPQKSGLHEALSATIPGLAKSGSKDARVRWFALVGLLKPKLAKGLMQSLADALGHSSTDQDLHLLKAGGVQFLKQGAFGRSADRSLQLLVIPLLQKKEGRDWLKDNAEEVAGWVQRATQGGRTALLSVLNKLHESKVEERRYAADFALNLWNLAAKDGG